MFSGTKKHRGGNILESTYPRVQISWRVNIPEEESPGGKMSRGEMSLDGNVPEWSNPWGESAEGGVVLGGELS